MSDTIVIDGEVELLNVIDGDPDVFIGGGGSQPTGTKSILLTEAGTKTEDVSSYASAEINAVKSATASGAIASFSDGAEDVPMDSCVVDIEPVQSGSGNPSQSNVRPISGWSEVKVSVKGINVWDEQWEAGTFNLTTGLPQALNNYFRSKNRIHVKGGETYYIYPSVASIYLFFYDANDNYLRYGRPSVSRIQIPSDAVYLRFVNISTNTYDPQTAPISINYPDTDTTYHAYTGTSYSISLGQTVYGGTLDVVSGVLTVDRAIVDLGSLTWLKRNTSSGHYRFTANTDIYQPSSSTQLPNILCSAYPIISPDDSWRGVFGISCNTGSSQILVSDESYETAVEFKTAMNGVQLVYELATPTTVQLTPTEVKTLLGNNSVWADSGNISVGYKADIYLYAESLETIIDTLTGGA